MNRQRTRLEPEIYYLLTIPRVSMKNAARKADTRSAGKRSLETSFSRACFRSGEICILDSMGAVEHTVTHADSVLSGFNGKLPYKVKTSSANGQAMVNDGATLESFNEGLLTTGCGG